MKANAHVQRSVSILASIKLVKLVKLFILFLLCCLLPCYRLCWWIKIILRMQMKRWMDIIQQKLKIW